MKIRTILLWLCVALISWLAAFCYFDKMEAKRQPAAMARCIERDLRNRQQRLQELTDNHQLFRRLLCLQLNRQDFAAIATTPFYIRVYKDSNLLFWNANTIPVTDRILSTQPHLSVCNETICLTQRINDPADSSRYAEMIIPIFFHYEVANKYLYDHFNAGCHIPPSSHTYTRPLKNSIAIHALSGIPIFYISIPAIAIVPAVPDRILLLLLFTAIIASLITIHILAFYLSRKHGWLSGLGLLTLILVAISTLNYHYGFPFHLHQFGLFRPYTLTGSYLFPHFGDLLLNILLIYWLLSFILTQSAVKKSQLLPSYSSWLRWLFVLLIYFSCTIFSLYMLHLMQLVVTNPEISFTPETFNITDKFTLLILVTIAVITRIFMITVQLTGIYTDHLVGNSRLKYLMMAAVGLICIIYRNNIFPSPSSNFSVQEHVLYIGLFLPAILYSYLQNNSYRRTWAGSHMFALIFQGAYWSLLCAVFFKFYIVHQEQATRVNFARQLSAQHNQAIDQQISTLAYKLRCDDTIRHWLSQKTVVPLRISKNIMS